MAEGDGDVVSGAAQGAAAGAAVGSVVPGIGTVIGAVVGGIIGAVGGLFSKKGKKLKRRAANEQRAISEREQAVQRRDIVRQLRFVRAQALASGSSESGGGGSAVQGAVASIGSQGSFNVEFFDKQVNSQGYIEALLKKARAREEVSGAIGGIVNAAGSFATIIGNMPGSAGGGQAPTQQAPTGAGSNSASPYRYAYNTYGTVPVLGNA